ncbi:MAG TPA: hypothetical protein VNZ60_03075 [Collimonas sp.]|jgi:hypothetical protein|nr:hypothetical protein [Collimonas sp.]HWW04253.1 hypothetical protein [Collimonas sp.]
MFTGITQGVAVIDSSIDEAASELLRLNSHRIFAAIWLSEAALPLMEYA